jgi:hypothetical protein
VEEEEVEEEEILSTARTTEQQVGLVNTSADNMRLDMLLPLILELVTG